MEKPALIDELLLVAGKNGASDLIVRTGDRVRMRINGDIVTVPADKVTVPDRNKTIEMIRHLVRALPTQTEIETIRNLDFHYTLPGAAHFRIHVLRTHNDFGIVARLIPVDIPDFAALRLPPVFEEITGYRNGLILMAGAAGSGKSTSMAAMLNHMIRHRPVHAVSLEDPVEFRYNNSYRGTVSQRELGSDVASYKQGLSDALRETPDIIVAGEVRGREEIQLALQAAETGHLVMSTVHATTAIGTMQRIMSSFPHDEQAGIRERLSENLRAIIVQKLLPMKQGKGRIVALEIMIRNSVIRHYILDPDHWGDIVRAMEEGHSLYGSQSFDQHLRQLVEDDLVSYEQALAHAVHREDFAMHFGKS
ncbi:type IV pilus twitching motility protein PilT [Mariprofundus ferrooxydans]|uniref:Pilus retraction protein PilT n=1 Tax=Mariprofundus ferrooxydans PV-1 TaxID=314345 RepID=Q0F284_9PROT|nr:PilT/PilU family type 4a pilus ATPase [Mariprofundus ferrooxydans]EAU55666.1 Pilus retraction protein PilT [Mariprofundus ferrooxydans PV-1]KON48604.1 twitching motility protein PilT [Mariprofundus ferrooxydans]